MSKQEYRINEFLSLRLKCSKNFNYTQGKDLSFEKN